MSLFRPSLISCFTVVWVASFGAPLSSHAEADDSLGSPTGAWRFEARSSRRDAAAIAFSANGRRLAFATPSGVWLRALGVAGEAQRVPIRDAEVRDLRFADDGALWVGTDAGLFAVDREGRVIDRSPAPGSGREIRRFGAGALCTVVATGRGVFEETSVGAWREINGEAPDQDVTALACDGRRSVWLVSAGDLYEVTFKSLESGTNSTLVKRHVLPGLHEPILDLGGAGQAGEAPLVLTRRRLFERQPDGQWTGIDLPLAPGVDARRILGAADRLWIAAERGLYEAPTASGPWRLADESLADRGFAALGSDGTTVVAAGERGVIERVLAASPEPTLRVESTNPPPAPLAMPEDPDRGALQRAVLAYLELDRGPGRSLAARARARGWLPFFELRGAYGGARRRDLDYDQAFTSGEDRLFLDRDRSRSRDFDVAAVLRWDLGDTVFHPEELDVAKERREIIELRDEVLDEVHRLYFERQRVLLAWSALGDAGVPEARALALRADELGAGLDAWTGGWWNARVPSLFSSRLDLESMK